MEKRVSGILDDVLADGAECFVEHRGSDGTFLRR